MLHSYIFLNFMIILIALTYELISSFFFLDNCCVINGLLKHNNNILGMKNVLLF